MNKPKKGEKPGFTTPLLQELVDRAESNFKIQNASLAQKAVSQKAIEEPAALYQDAGGGYNVNFVFPQE